MVQTGRIQIVASAYPPYDTNRSAGTIEFMDSCMQLRLIILSSVFVNKVGLLISAGPKHLLSKFQFASFRRTQWAK